MHCLTRTVSRVQSSVAAKIINSPFPKEGTNLIITAKPAVMVENPKICQRENFSFRVKKARMAIHKNIVLWMNEPVAAEVMANPLKNRIKGIAPPINDTNINISQSFFFNFLICGMSGKAMAEKIIPGTMFLSAVSKTGSVPAEMISLFAKLANPLIRAVKSANLIPLFMICRRIRICRERAGANARPLFPAPRVLSV